MSLDSRDLSRLLLSGDLRASGGAYDHDTWSVYLADGPTRELNRLVSLHESLHEDLSASTVYGALLHVVAFLARNMDESSDDCNFRSTFRSLLSRCRWTHECFATFLSVLLIGEEKGMRLLVEYPGYHRFVRIGQELASGFRGAYLRYRAAACALRLCLQGTMVETVLQSGLHDFQLSDFRIREFPDERLRIVRRIATPNFWTRAFGKAREHRRDLPGWEVINDTELREDFPEPALSAELDETSNFLMEHFHQTLAEEMLAVGYPSLAFDGHLEYVRRLIEAADKIIPSAKVRHTPLRARDKESDEEVIVGSFQHERLVLSNSPYRAVLARFVDVPQARWNELSAGQGLDAHFFIAVRNGHRILEQYAFSDEDRRLLQSVAGEPVVVLRRSRVSQANEDRIVEFFILESPAELERLGQAFEWDMPFVSSISMAALSLNSWAEPWYGVLRSRTSASILFDLSPFSYFHAWRKKKTLKVSFQTLGVQVGEISQTAFCCRPQTDDSSAIIAPCSSVVADALTFYLTELTSGEAVFELRVPFEDAEAWSMQVTLGHLFREETFFDFGAGRELNRTRGNG